MARLIVEVGGTTRRFKLGDGKLTLGSGESATLTLASEELAEVHAEIEVSGDQVTVRTRKGTLPPKVRGVDAKGDVVLKPGTKVVLGDVTLSLEGDAPAAAPTARPRADKAATARSGGRAAAPRGGGAGGGGTRARVQRSRPSSSSQALPSWLIVTLILAIAGVGFLMFRSQAESLDDEGFSAKASQVRLEKVLGDSDFRSGRKEIEKVKRHWDELDANWRTVFAGFEKRVEEAEEEARLLAKNAQGDPFYQSQLANYIPKYLSTPSRPAARVLLKRINWFEKEYPRHPKLDQLRKWRERWRATAAMNEPANYDDVAWEFETLTWSNPRDYKTAFALLDGFLVNATASERARGEALRAERIGQRKEYYDEELLQAKHEYGMDSGEQKAKAVRGLTELITKIGDDAMANQAAEIMVAIPGIDGPIQGYYNYERWTFDALMENGIVRRYIESNKVVEGL